MLVSNSEAGMIADKRNDSLENEVVLADEQKDVTSGVRKPKTICLFIKLCRGIARKETLIWLRRGKTT